MTDAFLPLSLHASALPAPQREGLQAALRARRLPGALLYQSPAQAQRWLDYHAAWSPSRTDAGLRALYDEAFRVAATALHSGLPADLHAGLHGGLHRAAQRGAKAARPALLLGVGCGGGSKDADLLQRLADAAPGRPLAYVPLDASAPLVAEAALQARRRCPAAAVHPLVADVAAAPALDAWLDAAAPGAARLLSAIGMLPNQDVHTFPAWLAGLLRPGDALLVSANLSPDGLDPDGPRILRQYDNPPARAWYAGALAELGLAGDAYTLDVVARPLPERLPAAIAPGAAWQVAAEAVLHGPLRLAVYGQTLAFPAGTRLIVFDSLRFTADAAATLLEAAGLSVTQRWVGGAGEEGLFLCAKA